MTYFSHLTPEKGTPKLVGFLAFDGMTTLDLTGPLEAFATARMRAAGHEAAGQYETMLIGVTSKTIKTASGAVFKAQHILQTAPVLDTIIVPGGPDLRNSEVCLTIAEWMRDRAKGTRRIASVSAGIYPLARSGLLDGRRVTTHWRFARDVARSFPLLLVNDAASFITDGGFYTCGGGAAGIEMSLAMIEDDFGSQAALIVARELVMSLRPAGCEERQVDLAHEQAAAEERLAELPAWINSRLRDNLSIEVLAARACLCPRHFSRLFKRTFNSTPAEFVEGLRISEAARRLASRRLSVEGIAAAIGFKSTEVFRRAFERRFGITPRNFQKSCRHSSTNPYANPKADAQLQLMSRQCQR
jgi:transcriptional regulator GlxA family with amidase domain